MYQTLSLLISFLIKSLYTPTLPRSTITEVSKEVTPAYSYDNHSRYYSRINDKINSSITANCRAGGSLNSNDQSRRIISGQNR